MAQRTTPKISVIVPVFNTAKYLHECLNSVLSQTLADFEIICVDNGSTDSSLDILKEYVKLDDRVRLICCPQGGTGAARNEGLQAALGEFIAFVDSDDYISPAMLELMYQKILKSDSDICICNIDLYYPLDGRHQVHLPETWFCNDSFSIDERPHFLRNLTIANKIFRHAFLRAREIRFPTLTHHEDQQFVIKALFCAQSIVCRSEPLYTYRKQRAGSVSEHRGARLFDIFLVLEETCRQLESLRLGHTFQSLWPEVQAQRLLQIYAMLPIPLRRRFLRDARKLSSTQSLPVSPRLLSRDELHTFKSMIRLPWILHEAKSRILWISQAIGRRLPL